MKICPRIRALWYSSKTMIILSIETSCDETAVSVLEAKGTISSPRFSVLGNALYSQVKLHEKYGGVFPNLAKREHAKNLPTLFQKSLLSAKMLKKTKNTISNKTKLKLKKILEREGGLSDFLIQFAENYQKPKIDSIAVTYGPGLEPALWVGINFAKALNEIWNVPVIPVNHMEGHIVSVMYEDSKTKRTGFRSPELKFPAIALLVSGGHTELVLVKKGFKYKMIGETRDDAVGEAYDKVARMLNLPYPGGPFVAKLANESRKKGEKPNFKLPRPMIHSDNYDFSFSGLKTSVLYTLKKQKRVDKKYKRDMARAFEDSVLDILSSKTESAIKEFKPKSLISAGGVISNNALRKALKRIAQRNKLNFLIPQKKLATDNSIMIGMAGFIQVKKTGDSDFSNRKIVATGNAPLI